MDVTNQTWDHSDHQDEKALIYLRWRGWCLGLFFWWSLWDPWGYRYYDVLYIYIYMHACMHACMHAYIHTFIHTYIHTYIHTFIHTYIHTYMYIYIYIIRLIENGWWHWLFGSHMSGIVMDTWRYHPKFGGKTHIEVMPVPRLQAGFSHRPRLIVSPLSSKLFTCLIFCWTSG